MRLFGSERIMPLVDKVGLGPNDPIDFSLLSKQIESAQKRVEGRNFDIRKNVLQYDDVMNKQREIIYGQRRQVLDGGDLHDTILGMAKSIIGETVATFCTKNTTPDLWDLDAVNQYMQRTLSLQYTLEYTPHQVDVLTPDKVTDDLYAVWQEQYAGKERDLQSAGADLRELERILLLRVVDSHWMDHIDAMDQLRQGIGLRAYGQRDPVVEYRMEGSNMFDEMIHGITEELVSILMRLRVDQPAMERKQATITRASAAEDAQRGRTGPAAPAKAAIKVGRNDLCPCGSGKKYKNCHGRGVA